MAGDLAISPGQSHDRIVCKTVAWLPREQEVDGSPLWVAAKRLRPGIRAQSIEQIPNPDLRRAIRANWVSFPSQVPTFPSCTGHEQQRKVAQLYFVLGWSVTSIAGRYAMSRRQSARCFGRVETEGGESRVYPAHPGAVGCSRLRRSARSPSRRSTASPLGGTLTQGKLRPSRHGFAR